MDAKSKRFEGQPGEIDLSAWSRDEGEDEERFAAYRVYLMQDSPRSVAAAVEQTNHKRSKVYMWAKKHRWVERAARWDQAIAFAEGREVAAKRMEITNAHLRMFGKIRIIAEKNINRLLRECQTLDGEGGRIGIKALTALMDKVVHYERLIVGEVTARTESEEHIDVSRLTESDLVELKKLEEKINAERSE
jgi:hypothetical protein